MNDKLTNLIPKENKFKVYISDSDCGRFKKIRG